MLSAQSAVRLFLAGAAVLLLAACGQKGPLFMNTPPPDAVPPAAVEVEPQQTLQAPAEEAGEAAKETVDQTPAETTLEVREQLEGG
ncbi:MAG: lipoprotein [Pseudomonadota bacterium]|nr:lipoprotein [Pseudomonadota bacterium]